MLIKLLLSLTVLALISIAAACQQAQPVFACRMDKLTKGQRNDLKTAIYALIDSKPAAKEISDGYELTFPSCDHYVDAATWIRYERLCCPFFHFSIELSQDNGPMTIRLTGPKGVKEFIADDLPGLKALTSKER